MRRGELADLTAFVAVADTLSFRAAAARLGVTPSALSHKVRQLEERVGVRLLNRTTRSVAPTDAGRRLLARLRPAMDQIASALDDLDGERTRPFGRLRIYATHLAGAAVLAPVWARFLSTYPDVHLEVALDDAATDIVARGFDAGMGRCRYRRGPRHGAEARGRRRRPEILRIPSAAADPGRFRATRMHSVPAGLRRIDLRVGVGTRRSVAAPSVAGRLWSTICRSRIRSRPSRSFSCSPASWSACSKTGRRASRGCFSISRPPAGSGAAPRLDRHDSRAEHGSGARRFGFGQFLRRPAVPSRC
jgi:DNA-binding transcriptional LysR family regulator